MGGALLVASSALRAQRATEREMDASMRRELQRFGHGWMRRLDYLGSVAGGIVGVVALVYAVRSHGQG
jgi:hypothetical protein